MLYNYLLGPPGPPGAIHLISSKDTSLLVDTKLSPYSYISIISVTFVVTGPDSIINHTIHAAATDLEPDTFVTADIYKLEPSTFYSIHAYATNSVGNSENSENSTFITRKKL